MRKLLSMIGICCVMIFDSDAVSAHLEAKLFDKFGDVCCDEEKALLDNFTIELQNNPELTGYIIFYGGRRHSYLYCHSSRLRLPRRGEAEARAARLKPYIFESRGIYPARIVVINGGFRETWEAELWVMPKEANPPTPTPTVRLQDIRYRKGRARGRDYHCEV